MDAWVVSNWLLYSSLGVIVVRWYLDAARHIRAHPVNGEHKTHADAVCLLDCLDAKGKHG